MHISKLTYLLIALIAVFAASSANAVEPMVVPTDTIPVYVRIIDDGDDDYKVSDSVFYEIAGTVIFKVNRTELNLDAPVLKEIVERVVPMTRSRKLKLHAIELRGAASPEGPYWNNVRLSHGRAEVFCNFISQYLDSDAISKISINTVAEDYNNLLLTLQRMGDQDAPIVESIINECGGPDNHFEIKARLQAYDGGKLWDRLLRDIYPGLRGARMVLYFSHIDSKRAEYVAPPAAIEPWLMPVDDPVAALPHQYDAVPRFESQHMISLGTNLLYDAFYLPQYGWAPSPNLQLEFYPKHGNFTVQAAFLFPYFHRWNKHKFYQIRDYHIEVRRYFNPGKHHTGTYLGLYANANKYGIGFSATKGWEGEGWGAAIKAGYVLRLGGRWRMDLHAAVGWYTTRHDPYVWGNPITGDYDGKYYYDYVGDVDKFNRRNHRFSWIGPTELGITITYDIINYKKTRVF